MDTEARIFEAAQTVFFQKGLAQTTMQDIASEAGISRTSLHYYYRSKEKLFEVILSCALDNVLPKINDIVNKEIPLLEKIIEIAHNYLDLLYENQQLPGFMALELRRNPNMVIEFIAKKSTTINFGAVKQQMSEEIEAGIIRPFDLSQMIVAVAGMCVFPFICKPVLEDIFAQDDSDFSHFIIERKKVITEIITNWLSLEREKEKERL